MVRRGAAVVVHRPLRRSSSSRPTPRSRCSRRPACSASSASSCSWSSRCGSRGSSTPSTARSPWRCSSTGSSQGQFDLFWAAVQGSLPFVVLGLCLGAAARTPRSSELDAQGSHRCRRHRTRPVAARMTMIVQITPEIGPGTGVGAVAHHLEQEWQRQGVTVKRFTLGEAAAAGSRARPAAPSRPASAAGPGGLVLHRRHSPRPRLPAAPSRASSPSVTTTPSPATSTSTTASSRRRCVRAATTGCGWLRNPLHLFTSARDRHRYSRPGTHRLVVNLVTRRGAAAARGLPPARHPDRRHRQRRRRRALPAADRRCSRRGPCSGWESVRRRASCSSSATSSAARGSTLLESAVATLPGHVHLVVVGGRRRHDPRGAGEAAASERWARALHFAGAQPDPRPWLHAADVPGDAERLRVVRPRRARGSRLRCAGRGDADRLRARRHRADGVNGAVVEAAPSGGPRARAPAGARAASSRADHGRPPVRRLWQHSWTRSPGATSSVMAALRRVRGRVRVLHAVRSDAFAGVERYVARLADAQSARGDHVFVIGGETHARCVARLRTRVGHVPAATVVR